jgi:acetylornithine deacetylase/succinyl-diaminopimelate desuccinylase-like protein
MDVQTSFEEFDRDATKLKAEYFEFLRIPSVSSEAEYSEEVLRCASFVEDLVRGMGMTVERWTGKGHPTIFAEHIAGEQYPTVIFYNHYDVQPVDPLPEWESPPFEPTERDGKIFARGAVDNKGQCFYTLAAIRSLLRRDSKPPINIKLIIEGEEETGSNVLYDLLDQKKDRLKGDYLVITDVGISSLDRVSITLGIRGMVQMSATLRGSRTDLHSGMLGGVVYNPNRAAGELIASFYDKNGRVAVEGFYDDVVDLTPEEAASFDLQYDIERFKQVFQAEDAGGEHGLPPLMRAWMRPTLEINGVGGGYTGSGFKTVIPAETVLKISARLVPNQTPEKIAPLIEAHIRKHTPKGVSLNLDIHHGPGKPMRTSASTKIAKIASQAVSEAFGGKPCGVIATGGSLPVISELVDVSGAQTVFLGLGLDTDQMHAPNEHFSFDRMRYGYAIIQKLVELLAAA